MTANSGRFTSENAAEMGRRGAAAREENFLDQFTTPEKRQRRSREKIKAVCRWIELILKHHDYLRATKLLDPVLAMITADLANWTDEDDKALAHPPLFFRFLAATVKLSYFATGHPLPRI